MRRFALLAAISNYVVAMAKMGRPTQDPKDERLTVRLAPHDMAALEQFAQRHATTLAEAARRLLREALGILARPKKKSKKRPRRKT